MITRVQMLTTTVSEPSLHRAYYAQYVTDAIRSEVGNRFGKAIMRSSDPAFNDIPLSRWDRHAWIADTAENRELSLVLGERPVGYRQSQCWFVCVLKEAARQWWESATPSEATG